MQIDMLRTFVNAARYVNSRFRLSAAFIIGLLFLSGLLWLRNSSAANFEIGSYSGSFGYGQRDAARERLGISAQLFTGVYKRSSDASAVKLAARRQIADLAERARSEGPLPIIVELQTEFAPEGSLGTEAKARMQRASIARAQESLLSRLPGHDTATVKRFRYSPFLALTADAELLRRLAEDPEVAGVREDRRAYPFALGQSAQLIGAPAAWAGGFTGQGQTVAILDSGVDGNHPFLAGKVVSEACYSGGAVGTFSLCPGGLRQAVGAGTGRNCDPAIAGCDHGTHVAGIAAGKANNFSGVAPDAQIIAIQVFSGVNDPNSCAKVGSSTPCLTTYESDYGLGLEQVLELRNQHRIAAVNLSLGGGQFFAPCDNSDPMLKATIDNLRSVGIATVVASGNESYTNSLASPACISSAISVGSTDDGSGGTFADFVSDFSNSASFLKLLAPGRWINSSILGGGYENFRGTSMAAPHVAGAWAVLKQKAPNASVDQVLSALASTGVAIQDGRNGVTKPRIRLDASLNAVSGPNQQCVAQPISIGQTVQGVLTTSDCPNNHQDGVRFEDGYSFSAAAGQQVTIQLSSDVFDTYLALLDASGRVVNEDNNGGGGTNSRLNQTLPTSGNYIIVVTSNLTNRTGAYTLQLSGQSTQPSPSPGNFVQLTSGQPAPGSVAPPTPPNTGQLDDQQYTIQIPANAIQLKIQLSGDQPARVYGRFGQPVTIQNGQAQSDFFGPSASSNSFSLTLSSTAAPPAQLRSGTLYLAVANFGTSTLNFTITATVTTGQQPPPSPGGAEELKTDDGSPELGASGPGAYLLNRLTPTSFPVTLRKIRVYYDPRQNGVPNPTGVQLRLLAFTGPAGQPPNRPSFTFDQAFTFPTPPNGDFVDFDIPNGPTVNAGQDLFVGFQTPTAPLTIFGDANGAQQNRSYFSSDGQNFSNIVFTDQQGNRTPVNLMIRAVVAGGGTGNCTYSLSPTGRSFTAAGGADSVNVTAPNGCAWTAASDVNWISIQSGNQGSGNGPVIYSVQANTGANQRQGTLTIAGQTFTVTQDGAPQVSCPTVNGITPTSGPVGASVTINGSNFTGVTQVRFTGGATATPNINSAGTQITVTVPTGAQSGPLSLVKPGCSDAPTGSFQVTQPNPNTPRVIRVVETSGAPGAEVRVPITIESQGDEVAIQFSLDFNPALLSYVQAEAGADARDILAFPFNPNTTLLGQGKVGLVLFLNRAIQRGQREIAAVRFRISGGATSGQVIPLSFSNTPTRQSVIDTNAQQLDKAFANGAVTIAQGFEGDVNNDGEIDITDAQLVVIHLRDTPSGPGVINAGAAFQRADCAPKADKGDGFIDVADLRQILIFQAASERVPVGGPSAPSSAAAGLFNRLMGEAQAPRRLPSRRLRIEPDEADGGRFPRVLLDAGGGESALSFSVNFDPRRARFIGAAAGEDAGEAVLIVNSTRLAEGSVGIALLMPPGQSFATGARRVIKLGFSAVDEEGAAASLSFGDEPIARRIVDEQANAVEADFASAFVKLSGGGAALVSAADYNFDALPAEAIVAAFGANLATGAQAADESWQPLTLAGTVVTLRDSRGAEHAAPLLFVSPEQINFRIPAGAAAGPAVVTIRSGDGSVSTGLLRVAAGPNPR